MDSLVRRVAARYKAAKANVEPHVRRSAMAMLEELQEARKKLDKAEQFSRNLRSEPSLDWIPEMVEKAADEYRELSKSIEESLEYLADR
jgi:hypothetical protein